MTGVQTCALPIYNGKDDDVKADVKTCFDSYKNEDILSVMRNGLVLSTIRKEWKFCYIEYSI